MTTGKRESERCETCKFFRQQEGYEGGQCWRYPPTPTANYAFDGMGTVQFDNMRPYVQTAEVCGEWFMRPHTEAENDEEMF
jgi:hypothetical protein